VRPFLSVATLANLSDWPKEKIVTFRRLLRNEPLVSPHDLFAAQKPLPHGYVAAIREMIGRLRLDGLSSAQRCCERRSCGRGLDCAEW